MQTKLFTAEEKIEGLQTKNLRQRVEETWHKKSKQVCCWANQVKEKKA
jgi:hypothetical protein